MKLALLITLAAILVLIAIAWLFVDVYKDPPEDKTEDDNDRQWPRL